MAGKANKWNEYEMLTLMEVKLLCNVGLYGDTHDSTMGYKYKMEFILRNNWEARKQYTISPEVSLFHTNMCLDREIELNETQKD